MEYVFVLGFSAIVPSLLLLWYFIASDRNSEPRGVLIKTFLWGVFIIFPVLPLVKVLEPLGAGLGGNWGKAFTEGVLGAGIPEEFLKFLVLMFFVWRQPAFDEPMDGIVYGATVSLGFATFENILYVAEDGLGVAVLRAFTAVPGHAFLGAILGAHVGMARFGPPDQRVGTLARGLLWAMFLHGAYDMVLFSKTAWCLLAFPILFYEMRWTRALVAEARALQVPVVVPALAMAGGPVMAAYPVPAPYSPPPQAEVQATQLAGERPGTLWSLSKLGMGGVGLTAASLWFVILAVAAGTSDSTARMGILLFAVVSLLPTWGCFALFRSGLKGLMA